jgi:seryl-tRNA synthetase
MSELEILKFKLNAKENELSKNLQTFILNPNITNLMTEIQELKKEISNLEDIENEQSN